MNIFYYNTRVGKIGISEINEKITNLYFENDILPQNYNMVETPLLKEAFRQLQEYLTGRLKEFVLPLEPSGTEFMKKIWVELCCIPYGKTVSYSHIAKTVGSPKACRAVGLANNRNPIPIFIPCHRVVGTDGSLTGYRGGLPLKKALLDLECARCAIILH